MADRWGVAYHEAGHAVVAYLRGVGPLLASATPGPGYLGQVLCTPRPAASEAADAAWLRNQLLVGLAGLATTEQRGGQSGFSADADNVWRWARELVGEHPDDALIVGQVVADAWAEVCALVKQHWWAIKDVATQLHYHGTLEGERLQDYIAERVAFGVAYEQERQKRYGWRAYPELCGEHGADHGGADAQMGRADDRAADRGTDQRAA